MSETTLSQMILKDRSNGLSEAATAHKYGLTTVEVRALLATARAERRLLKDE